MAAGKVARTEGVRLVGVVSGVPARRVVNADLADQFGDKIDDVIKMTGVEERRVGIDGLTTSDLCVAAGTRLLNGLGWSPDSVDAVIFVSQTPDYRLPATACLIQERLGLRTDIAAFDVNLGCSGYPYAIWLGAMMVQTGAARRVLLAVGDTSSRLVDPLERGTALLFGDCGTMSALEADENAGQMTFLLGSDGSGGNNLIIPEGAFSNRAGDAKLADRRRDVLYMDGGEIFNFTLKAVPALIRDTVESAGHSVDDYDYFLLHQANRFMLNHLAKKAKIPAGRAPMNIDRFGNTSSASIPLLMCSDLGERLTSKPSTLCMAGFGVGYSWASLSVTTKPLDVCEMVEL